MKSLLYLLILLAAAFLLVFLQHYLPPITLFHGARVQLLPILVVFVALAVDFPLALAFACLTGLLWDASTIPYSQTGQAPIPFGFTLLLYGLATLLCHGCRNWFLAGRYYLHPLGAGILTSGILLLEYLLLTYSHRSWHYDPSLPWRIFAPGLLNLCLAPLFLFPLWLLTSAFGFQLQSPKKRRRYLSRDL